MNLTKQKKIVYLFLISLIVTIGACAGSKDNSITKSANNKKNKKLLVTGEKVTEDETYASVSGSLARLQTMMCGKFVHHVPTNNDSLERNYTVWLVNDGLDSMVHYYLPIGDPNKEGYWIYMHQCLTSLPDQPTFSALLKLEKMDRDTIKCAFHKMPSDFNYDLELILEDKDEALREINLLSIEEQGPFSMLYFVRKSPIHFLGIQSSWESREVEGTPIKFVRRHYDVQPSRVFFYKWGYDENKKAILKTKGEFYLKEAMVRLDVF